MTFGPIIDVAIGLILVFLLMGLIVTSFQEFVLSWVKLRGKFLRQSIADLVADGDRDAGLFQKVYGHAMVQGAAANELPSYVPSRNFTLALIDTITEGSQAPVFGEIERKLDTLPDGTIKQTLQVLVKQAGGDLDVLKSDLARWYDDAMERLGGKYKRFSQWFAFVSGLVIAVSLNVDTIRIGDTLMHDSALRQKLVTAAEAQKLPENTQPAPAAAPVPVGVAPGAVAPAPETADAKKAKETANQEVADNGHKVRENVANLLDLDLPIGWRTTYIRDLKNPKPSCVIPPDGDAAKTDAVKTAGAKTDGAKAEAKESEAKEEKVCSSNPFVAARNAFGFYFQRVGFGGYVLAIVGWLMTAFAASLGAPFWFDLLQRFLQIRGTGKKPKTAAEEEAR